MVLVSHGLDLHDLGILLNKDVVFYLYRDGLSKDFVAHGCTTTHFAAHAVRDMIHKGHMPTRLPSCAPALFLWLFRWCFI